MSAITATVVDPEEGAGADSGILEAGGTLSLALDFAGAGFVVSGTVRALDDVSPLPATVELGGFGSTEANDAGEYQFTGVPAGTYTLTGSFDGRSASRFVTVPAARSKVRLTMTLRIMK